MLAKKAPRCPQAEPGHPPKGKARTGEPVRARGPAAGDAAGLFRRPPPSIAGPRRQSPGSLCVSRILTRVPARNRATYQKEKIRGPADRAAAAPWAFLRRSRRRLSRPRGPAPQIVRALNNKGLKITLSPATHHKKNEDGRNRVGAARPAAGSTAGFFPRRPPAAPPGPAGPRHQLNNGL